MSRDEAVEELVSSVEDLLMTYVVEIDMEDHEKIRKKLDAVTELLGKDDYLLDEEDEEEESIDKNLWIHETPDITFEAEPQHMAFA
jgi:hypothetical protein